MIIILFIHFLEENINLAKYLLVIDGQKNVGQHSSQGHKEHGGIHMIMTARSK